MKPIRDWKNVQAAGSFVPLGVGGYKLKIMKVEETVSKEAKMPMLVISFDIAEGPRSGYYTNQYRNSDRADKKWAGNFYQMLPVESEYGTDSYNKSASRLKAFTTSLEESNPGYKWDWNENALKGKLIGGVFGREEYKGNDGKNHWATKCRYFCSVQTIENGDYNIPEDKELAPKQNFRYSNYSTFPPAPPNQPMQQADQYGFTSMDFQSEEDLPF